MKMNIKNTLLGLLAVPALVLGVVAAPAYAQDANCTGLVSGGLSDAAKCAKGGDQPDNLFGNGGIFQTVTNVLLFIIGAVSVIMLIIGGIRYTVSQGDSSAVTSAKNTILYAIIGLVVAILAYAAVNFVIGSFAANSQG
ncbi:pilin [Patescibacteria group bacterium]|nr:pilin [Patescibacteria group bacterium]